MMFDIVGVLMVGVFVGIKFTWWMEVLSLVAVIWILRGGGSSHHYAGAMGSLVMAVLFLVGVIAGNVCSIFL